MSPLKCAHHDHKISNIVYSARRTEASLVVDRKKLAKLGNPNDIHCHYSPLYFQGTVQVT